MANNIKRSSQGPISSRGPKRHNVPMDRLEQSYQVTDLELGMYAEEHGNASLWSNIAVGSLTTFAACVWDVIISEKSIKCISVGQGGFSLLCLAVFIASLLFCFSYKKKSSAFLHELKRQADAYREYSEAN